MKKVMSHSDDMRKSNDNIGTLDDDLLEKLEKILPVSKEVKMMKAADTTRVIDAGIYLENGESINYNKLLTDEVLAADKLLVEAAKKDMNIAGK